MPTIDYTTTRENWELRLREVQPDYVWYYTTTRENWELRLPVGEYREYQDYTTTRENWELRRFNKYV